MEHWEGHRISFLELRFVLKGGSKKQVTEAEIGAMLIVGRLSERQSV